MNKINNPVMPFLIVVISLLTFNYLYKVPVNNTAFSRKGGSIIKESVEPDPSNGKENTVSNPFAFPKPFSEKEFQSFETIETEGINTKFAIGIIL
jgi:hypothetical protein